MTDETRTQAASKQDQEAMPLRRFREYVTALFGMVMVIGFLVIVVISIIHSAQNEAAFGRIKDLLLIVNPFVGMVLGYYFNKTTSEARAENAEQAAQSAQAQASQATAERIHAVSEAQTAKAKEQEIENVLEDVYQAAEAVVTKPEASAAPGVISAGGAESAPPQTIEQMQLERALARARKYI